MQTPEIYNYIYMYYINLKRLSQKTFWNLKIYIKENRTVSFFLKSNAPNKAFYINDLKKSLPLNTLKHCCTVMCLLYSYM